MLISEHNPVSMSLHVLETVAYSISTVDEEEAMVNLCIVVERWSRESALSGCILDDLEKVLTCGNLDATILVSQAIKQSIGRNATVPESVLFTMCQVINNQEANLGVK